MKITNHFFSSKIKLFSLIFLAIFSFLVISPVQADSLWNKQIGMGIDDQAGQAFGETVSDRNSVQDVRIVLAKLINIFLGFLGIIFLILIIYGGFMWMTANGQDDRVTKAKSLLVAGIIGLIIVLMSFAIAEFVTRRVFEATVTSIN